VRILSPVLKIKQKKRWYIIRADKGARVSVPLVYGARIRRRDYWSLTLYKSVASTEGESGIHTKYISGHLFLKKVKRSYREYLTISIYGNSVLVKRSG
jgi:hypothetical protein